MVYLSILLLMCIFYLITSRLVLSQFPANHFTHIIMDEVGQALEPEALIPLAGLATVPHGKSFTCQVVMAGDPKQLGPILQSPIAAKFGLGTRLALHFLLPCTFLYFLFQYLK